MLDVADRMSETTQKTFESMVGLHAEAGPLVDLADAMAKMEIVALVGLSGSSPGMLGMYSSNSLACHIAGGLLGTEPEEVNAEVRDAFGELANIIAGSVATFLGDLGETVQLSLPSVIVGQSLVTSILNVPPPRRARRFSIGGECLYVELALHRSEG